MLLLLSYWPVTWYVLQAVDLVLGDTINLLFAACIEVSSWTSCTLSILCWREILLSAAGSNLEKCKELVS